MSEDTIYRQAAIDVLEHKKDKKAKGDMGWFYNKIIQNDIDALIQLPSARPKGKWIFNPRDGIEAMFTKPKCSVCGFESADGLNYCPNCGAEMEAKRWETV